MDFIGPMGVSDRGNQYIMTITDVFIRFLITVPLKSKAAAEVARGFFYKSGLCTWIPQNYSN